MCVLYIAVNSLYGGRQRRVYLMNTSLEDTTTRNGTKSETRNGKWASHTVGIRVNEQTFFYHLIMVSYSHDLRKVSNFFLAFLYKVSSLPPFWSVGHILFTQIRIFVQKLSLKWTSNFSNVTNALKWIRHHRTVDISRYFCF